MKARYIAASTAAGRSTINKVGRNRNKSFFDILRHTDIIFSGKTEQVSENNRIFAA